MNILILVSSLNFGGAEKQAVLDANMLSESNNVHVGMFESGALREQLSPKVKVTLFKKQNYFFRAFRLASFIKKNKIQIVHNHLYAPMIIAALASLRAKVPVIWHFHGHHFEVSKPPLNILSRLPTVKRIVFVCAALADYFRQNYQFPESKIAVMYNSTQFKTKPQSASTDQTIRIGFVGRVVKLKRIQYLISLAAYLKRHDFQDFEIVIAGDGPEREHLEAKAQAEGVGDKMKFLGFRTDLDSLYNQFDIFILPSEEEALSLSLIDAGHCELPAIAFDVGGNKEIVLDGKTGYIVQSLEEMQQKAYQLCIDKKLRRELGNNAAAYTRIFNEKNHLNHLLDLYNQYA